MKSSVTNDRTFTIPIRLSFDNGPGGRYVPFFPLFSKESKQELLLYFQPSHLLKFFLSLSLSLSLSQKPKGKERSRAGLSARGRSVLPPVANLRSSVSVVLSVTAGSGALPSAPFAAKRPLYFPLLFSPKHWPRGTSKVKL